MANQYYDPNSWTAIDPSRVTKRNAFTDPSGVGQSYGDSYWYDGSAGGYQTGDSGSWWEDPTGKEARYGDMWTDYLDTKFGTKGNTRNDWAPTTRNWLQGLRDQYGIGVQDVENAYNEYLKIPGTGANAQSRDFWGDQASLYGLGMGFDKLNPTAAYKGSWEPLWNRAAYDAQQKGIGDRMQADQARGGSSEDWGDLMSVLGGVGAVLGAGALGGAFSGVGSAAPGWVSAEGGAGYLGGAAADAGALAGGVGNLAPAAEAVGTGGGSGGNMSWLDDLLNLTSDTPSVAQSGDVLSNLSSGNSWNLPTLDPNTVYPTMTTPGIDTGIGLGSGSGSFGGLTDAAAANMLNGSAWAGGGSFLANLKNMPTSALKSMFGLNDADASALAGLIGKGVGGLLDYKASSGQADALKAIADRSWAAGQPYRDRANAAMTPGFDIRSIPGLSSAMDTATETYLRKLSATNGNPAGIGAAPSQTQAYVIGNVGLPAWQNYFNANSNAGGLSNLSAQANQTAMGAAQADSGTWGSLGQTARQIFGNDDQYSQIGKKLASMWGLA